MRASRWWPKAPTRSPSAAASRARERRPSRGASRSKARWHCRNRLSRPVRDQEDLAHGQRVAMAIGLARADIQRLLTRHSYSFDIPEGFGACRPSGAPGISPHISIDFRSSPMPELATTVVPLPHEGLLEHKMKPISAWVSGVVVLVALVGGLGYIGVHIAQDMNNVVITSAWPYVLLGVALAIALGFEFVNGFHDTANAVATVIYTHSLDPNIAVVWSGLWNLTGVLLGGTAVAFSIVHLLPADILIHIGKPVGLLMVISLLVSAIAWNFG